MGASDSPSEAPPRHRYAAVVQRTRHRRHRLAQLIVVILVVTAACGGSEPTGTTADEPDQVPPADATPVEVVRAEIVAGSEGNGLRVDGNQPTPCHGLGWFVRSDAGRLEVTVWSEPPPADQSCVQVIEPFSIEIDLGPVATETEVVLNGEVVGSVG